MATIVSSGTASIKGALLTAAICNFTGAMIGGSAVVLTLQGVLTDVALSSLGVAIFSAVVAANAPGTCSPGITVSLPPRPMP